MSKALEIASERFAKGEITKEEFEEIKSILVPQEPERPQESPQAESLPSAEQPIIPPIATPPPRAQAAQPAGHTTTNQSPQRPTASHKLPSSYYDISWLSAVLEWLTKICIGIAGVSAFAIYRIATGTEEKYNLVIILEDDPIAAAATLGPFFITMIIFLYWKKKSTDNLFLLRGPQSVTSAGAIYWYFVPLAWFWKPYEAMRNIFVGYYAEEDDNKGLLALWWGTFWLSMFGVPLLGALFIPEVIQTTSEKSSYINWSIASYVAEAIWLYVALLLIEAVSKAQETEIELAQSTVE